MYRKYGNQVYFLVIYTVEAHPLGSASPYSDKEWPLEASVDTEGCDLYQPASYEVRVAQASQMADELKITVPVLIDEMDNPVWCTYGPAPNSAYLINTDGKVLEKQGWYQPRLMEAAITANRE